ncbi:UPF0721 transmembrane protein YunE [Caldalkalibacillus thermarum]|nr:UPF0721 transmembrane protein YunE [Caldalkalibacillus thermarum]
MFGLFMLLMIVGLVAGTIGSLVGLGGGVFIVPALIYLCIIYPDMQVSPQMAVGTSLVVVTVTALSSTLSYLKQKKVDVGCALLFFLASGPGAMVGAYINRFMEIKHFNLSFGLFMILMALLLAVKGKLSKKDISWGVTKRYHDPQSGEEYAYGYHRGLGLAIAFLVGMLSGLFGIGGGSLFVPAMILLFHFPVQVAAATSMFIIFLSSILGSATHYYFGHIDWWLVLGLAPGAWIGGRLGAYISTKMKAKGIELLLRLMLVIIGLRMIWQGIVG